MKRNEIKSMGVHEYQMRLRLEEKRLERLKKIQKVAGIGLISSFFLGWAVILLAELLY